MNKTSEDVKMQIAGIASLAIASLFTLVQTVDYWKSLIFIFF
ncbi:hypothetical protein [uncultured Nostoc sp.]